MMKHLISMAATGLMVWSGCSNAQNLGHNDPERDAATDSDETSVPDHDGADGASGADASAAKDGASDEDNAQDGDGSSGDSAGADDGSTDGDPANPALALDQTCSVGDQNCGSMDCCAGVCRNDRCACTGAGGNCQNDEQCCSGVCAGEVCAVCNPEGDSCSVHANCCTGNCVDGVCGGPVGQVLATFTVEGEDPVELDSFSLSVERPGADIYLLTARSDDNQHTIKVSINGWTTVSYSRYVNGSEHSFSCKSDEPLECPMEWLARDAGEHFMEGHVIVDFPEYFDWNPAKYVPQKARLDVTYRVTTP